MRHNVIYFTPLIRRALRSEGFVSIIIYGPQGVGKTTYALKIAASVYGSLEEALNHLYFSLEGLVNDLEAAFRRGERIPVVILDDAAISLHRQSYRESVNVAFEKIFNLSRTVCACFIFTTIHVSDILRSLRDKFMFRVSMQRIGKGKALAKIYEFYLLPTLLPHVRLVARQIVRLDIPPALWREYGVKRREAVEALFEEFRHALKRRARRKAREALQAQSVEEAWGLTDIDSKLGELLSGV